MEKKEWLDLIAKAYEYAFALNIMDLTRKQSTNVNSVDELELKAPHNQFVHYRKLPAGSDKSIVRFNFDTLYSKAWIDLRHEPVVLTVPNLPDRYHLTPIYDMWSDILAVPGTRTSDGKGQKYILVYGDHDVKTDLDYKVIKATTPYLWIMGRIQTNGPADYEFVNGKQDEYALTPLSQLDNPEYKASAQEINPELKNTDPQEFIMKMNGMEYFTYFAELLKEIPAHSVDYPILFQLEKLGITPGETFNPSQEVKELLEQGIELGIKNLFGSIGDTMLGTANGPWNWVQNNTGTYGSNYRLRTLVAYAGLGANLPEDALYPNLQFDIDGDGLNGENSYVLSFDKDNIPPAGAFWSLTMYDKFGFQVENELKRYALGDRDNLTTNQDGSFELYIQASRPDSDKISNWLPSPEGDFELTLRLYSPTEKALKNQWTIPVPRKEG